MTRHALSGVSVSSECGGYRSSPHITITPISFSYLPMINSSLTHLSILLGANDVEHGVFLDSGGDVDTEVIAVGSPPTEVRRTGNGRILPAADGNSNEDGTSAYYWMSGSLDVAGKTPFTTGTYIRGQPLHHHKRGSHQPECWLCPVPG